MDRQQNDLKTLLAVGGGLVILLIIFKWYILIPLVVIPLALVAYKIYSESAEQPSRAYIFDSLNDVVEIIEYQGLNGFDQEFIDKTHVFSDFGVFESSDYLKFKYKGLIIEMSDLMIQRYIQAEKSQVTVTLFSGVWFTFETKDHSFESMTLFDNYYKNLTPHINREGEMIGHKIEFDNIDFNQRYNVYGTDTDAVETYLSLHLQVILDFMQEHKIIIHVEKNRVHLGVKMDHNLFEPKSVETATKEAVRESIEREILQLLNQLDVLLELEKNTH